MAVTINNFANITYKSGTETDYALSNTATTLLAENYSLKASKSSLNTTFKPSENLSFLVRVENDGVDPIYAVSIQDNLGDNVNRPLTYIDESARMQKNGIISTMTPTNVSPLTLEVAEVLLPGEVVIFNYVAKVRGDIAENVTEITNSVTVVGHETSISGPTITVSPNPSVTIPRANYAEVRITKGVDKENVSVGEKLTYTFNLENMGNTEATEIVITDSLPTNFTVESIVSETNGVQTIFEASDYSIGEGNRLILPTSTIKTISVPARTISGNGLTTVTIVGNIIA